MSVLQHRAIEQTGRHEDVSDNYQTVNTRHIITSLENRGFELHGTQVAGARKESNHGFQKHLVTMTYEELRTEQGVPTVIVQNSHNRSSGLKFHTGFIRFACMNGLILGDGIEEKSIRHSLGWQEKATNFLDGYMEEVARMQDEHERMSNKRISRYQMMQLAEEAVQLRYKLDDVLDPNELNLVRRIEDRGNDLYTTYNRLQEGLLQGLFKRRVQHVNDEGILITSDWGKAAKITATDQTIKLNKELRELVLQVA